MSDKRTLPERLRAANSELLAFGNDYSDLLLEAAAEIEMPQELERLRQAIRDLVTRFDATANHELKWGSRNCGLGWHDAARELEGLLDRHLKARETNP